MPRETKLQQLAEALHYPATPSGTAREFSFFVDGLELFAAAQADGIVLRFPLLCSEELLPDFAQYAAGRLLREEAALAWDAQAATLFLWQRLPHTADAGMCRQLFEQFADSCEWWLARCSEKEVPRSVLPDILIRP